TPRSKFCLLKSTTALLSTDWPKYGSQRRPPLIVTRLDARQLSSAYVPRYQLWMSRTLGPPISSLDTRPTSRSAIDRPVALPSTVQLPPVREVERVLNFQWRTLAPKPSW